KPLNEEEQEIIRKAQRIIGNSKTVPCTACHYCTDGCPVGIDIPGIFSAMNKQLGNGQMDEAKAAYFEAAPEGRWASDCIGCGQCESACPQSLKIIDGLKQAAEMFEIKE
ncbi:MAG: 4Fe-4S dicluster domain-containing protein, partial [Firmicutes bacterium]|nr:4Fe-4S dicluster domain-containing protein [Bacillota bacterium]